MESIALNQSQKRREPDGYFGSSGPLRAVFIVLISIAAWTLAAVLAVTFRSVQLPPYPFSFLFYSFVAFHLMPWMIGLRNLRIVRRALQERKIDAAGANLSYSLILGMLVNTYVVLGAGETLAIMAYRLGTVHFG